MSKLEELIQQYCPDGVEYVKLGDIEDQGYIKLGRGNVISKQDMKDCPGGFPVYSSSSVGDGEIGRYGKYMFDDERISWSIDGGGKFFYRNNLRYSITNVSGWLKVLAPKVVSTKYLYYTLMNEWVKKVYDYTHKAHPSVIREEYIIPIPPLPVQKEIVRVLDTFTELQAELQAELQKRLQQYEYYRDNLIQKHCVGVEYKPLCELGTFYSGLTGKSKDDFSGGNAKFITYVNIFNHPSLETDVEEKVKIAEGEKQNTVQYGDMLFTGSSETPDECGMCSVLTHHTDEEMYLNSFCFGFRFNDLNDKSPDFMKHLFRSTDIRKKICKTANGVTRFNISKKEFAKIEIPLLPLDVQVKLAAILDRFFTLTTDLTAGLPAEIEKRKQQYEYYRDKLLTFKRITK
jgi:type I restriction enzyme S subunit